jgi:hypothetical protein
MVAIMRQLDVPCYALFMVRPRWHDAVIVLALLALTAVGIAAIWGDSIAELFGSEPAAEQSTEPAKPVDPI